jgi:F0F1-type ATP synthase delta subunit
MKKITLFFSLLFAFTLFSNAQSNKEEVEYIQSIFGMEKKAIVAEFIKLDGEAATSFWALYDQYETERKAHGQERISLLNKYVEQYDSLNDASTEAIMAEIITMGADYNKLINKYYKSIKKTSGIKPAAQFLQIESYFQSVIRLKIFENIPFIGEFDI